MRYVNGSTKVGSVFVARFVRGLFDTVFLFTGGIRGLNVENVPLEGGVIIAPIHLSHLDPPALACTMRHRRLLAMAKEELWKNKAFGWLIAQIGAHPVKRGEGDTGRGVRNRGEAGRIGSDRMNEHQGSLASVGVQ